MSYNSHSSSPHSSYSTSAETTAKAGYPSYPSYEDSGHLSQLSSRLDVTSSNISFYSSHEGYQSASYIDLESFDEAYYVPTALPPLLNYDTGSFDPLEPVSQSLSPLHDTIESYQEETLPRHDQGHNRSYVCLITDCTSAGFKRKADLERHQRNVHKAPTEESHFCDYAKCPRNQEPFLRRDHFRDHLREFHKENLDKRGQQPSTAMTEPRTQISARRRCYRCLTRISADVDACPQCRKVLK
jgi:hypothetical protein